MHRKWENISSKKHRKRRTECYTEEASPQKQQQNGSSERRAQSGGSPQGCLNPEQPLLAYLRQQPEDAEVRWNAAISFLSRGETSKAIEHFELALKDAPNDVGVLTGLAQAFIETGDNQRAAKLLEQALAESPDYEGRDEVERLLESLKN